jgi:hypothetical protein
LTRSATVLSLDRHKRRRRTATRWKKCVVGSEGAKSGDRTLASETGEG